MCVGGKRVVVKQHERRSTHRRRIKHGRGHARTRRPPPKSRISRNRSPGAPALNMPALCLDIISLIAPRSLHHYSSPPYSCEAPDTSLVDSRAPSKPTPCPTQEPCHVTQPSPPQHDTPDPHLSMASETTSLVDSSSTKRRPSPLSSSAPTPRSFSGASHLVPAPGSCAAARSSSG